jgi:hypothetical protein
MLFCAIVSISVDYAVMDRRKFAKEAGMIKSAGFFRPKKKI